jgi:predicted acetyltransferase
MAVLVRTPTAEDHPRIFRLVKQAFVEDLAQEFDESRPMLEDDRRLVAEADGRVVGHLGVWPLGHWLGGRRVATGGVSAVAIDPAWRGRGVGTKLLREALTGMAGRGEALATLFPLTRGVYRRLGWEIAGERPGWRVATAPLTTLPAAPDVEVVPGSGDDVGAMHDLETRLAPGTAGMLDRGEVFARRALVPGEDHAVYLARRGGELVGYVVYAHGSADEPGELFTLRVRELVAADGDAERALWRLLGSHASGARTARAVGPPTHPLELELPERALQPDPVPWRWMTRVVDLPRAVEQRGWAPGATCRVDLEIHDPLMEANDGRWRLEVADGGATLARGGDGLVRLDVGAAAALLTGWADPRMLDRAGRLAAAGGTDLDGLTAALAGRIPWIRDFF